MVSDVTLMVVDSGEFKLVVHGMIGSMKKRRSRPPMLTLIREYRIR